MNRRPWVRLVGVAAALVCSASLAKPSSRIVAIADVHGAYTEFVSILQRAGLADSSLNWAGGDMTFVQLGDVLDRGADSRKAVDLLMKLQKQAPEQNGRVIPLLGNHEMMDMMGDLRYVSAGEYAAFSSAQSEQVREKAYQSYLDFLAAVRRQGGRISLEPDREKWMAEHPPGFFELRDAYGTSGQYGRWFRRHDAVVQLGNAVFLHGGLDPGLHFNNVEELNKRVHTELELFDTLWKSLSQENAIWRYMTLQEALRTLQEEWKGVEAGTQQVSPRAREDMLRLLSGLPHWLIISPNGPLWYRGLAEVPEDELTDKLQAMMERLKIERIVLGHTVVSTQGVTVRFGGRVFLMDTGMLASYFHGRPSALEIQEGQFTAVYADGERKVLVAQGARQPRAPRPERPL